MKKISLFLLGGLILFSLFLNFRGHDFPAPSLKTASLEVHPYSDLEGYDDILALQQAFVRNAKRIKPSVVSINNLREIPPVDRSPDLSGSGLDWQAWLRYWLNRTFRRHYQMESLGSGIIYKSRGYIVTNAHVIKDTDEILVKLSSGEEYTAEVVGVDSKTDLAVLKIFSFTGFPEATLANQPQLEVGQWVMAIGNPYGLEGTVTVGVISGVQRNNLGIATFENFIQTDASINPGNSGGPLINLQGEVIGINTAIAEIGAGVGFAIPIDMVRDIADQLIEDGEVERGWLGVGIQTLTPELAESFQFSADLKGVLINSVEPGAPAAAGGLRQGDIIVAYDGRQVKSLRGLQQMVAETAVGKQVPIQILRDGKNLRVEVTIGKVTS